MWLAPFLILLTSFSFGAGQEYVVTVPVADLWSDANGNGRSLETQLLYGERVRVYEETQGDLVRAAALEQEEYTHHDRWESYPGWIRKLAIVPIKQFPKDVMARAAERRKALRRLSESERRRCVLEAARQMVGKPYLWGGRSPDAVDCSGLVNLAFRACGIAVPRDAHEQYMRATPVDVGQLKEADLIFSADAKTPARVSHVMLYAGEGRVLEGAGSGIPIREISFKQKTGLSLEGVSGSHVGDRVYSFGRFLK